MSVSCCFFLHGQNTRTMLGKSAGMVRSLLKSYQLMSMSSFMYLLKTTYGMAFTPCVRMLILAMPSTCMHLSVAWWSCILLIRLYCSLFCYA